MQQFEEAARIIWARRVVVLVVLLAGVVASFIGFKLARPTYAATSTVLMNAGGQGAVVSDGGFLGTDMPSLLVSDTVLTRFEHQEHMEGTGFSSLRKSIDAGILPESGIMPITYKARNPKAAVEGANALAGDLRDYYREISTRRYDDLANYLSNALVGERAKIEDTERQLSRLVATDPYFTQAQAGQAIGAQLLALNQQRNQVEATMESSAISASLAGQRMSDMAPTIKSELRNADPNYDLLSTQIAKDRTAETELEAQYTSKYAGIQSLQEQIKRSNQVLAAEQRRAESQDPGNSQTYGSLLRDRDNTRAVYEGDQAQLAAIERQIQAAEAHLARLPELGAKVAALRLDHDAANSAYQILAEQRTLTLSQQAQMAALGSVTIADLATTAEASVGKAALMIPVAAMLSFVILALALPFGLELIDRRLRRRDTIEQLYGRPLIGTVPA